MFDTVRTRADSRWFPGSISARRSPDRRTGVPGAGSGRPIDRRPPLASGRKHL